MYSVEMQAALPSHSAHTSSSVKQPVIHWEPLVFNIHFDNTKNMQGLLEGPSCKTASLIIVSFVASWLSLELPAVGSLKEETTGGDPSVDNWNVTNL